MGGRLVITSGQDCIRQTCEQRMKSIRGEWIYDLSHGVPYLDRMDTADLELIRAIFREVIAETPGVASVNRLDVTFDSRTRVVTVFSEVTGDDGVNVLLSPVHIETGGVIE